MVSAGAIWGPATLRLLRIAVTNTTKVVRERIANIAKPLQGQVQYIPIRNGRQPIHPAALLKQQRRGAKWFSSSTAQNVEQAFRRHMTTGRSTTKSSQFDRSKLPVSNTSRRVSQFSGRAPFASTLRPNLTGGAMPRSAGGYSLGGGSARYFSHTPAAPAQVVQNVSQAMRAFFLSGQKLRYDGVDSRGARKYRAVSSLEDDAMRKLAALPRFTLGSFIDFQLSPTITALSPLATAFAPTQDASNVKLDFATVGSTLNTEGFLDVLSTDFGRALQDLTAVYTDLRRLSVLGDLPVSLEMNNVLRIRFPGVDAESIHQICDDLGVLRGVVRQDPDFEFAVGAPMALQFPFAPGSQATLTSPGGSVRSLEGNEFDDMSSMEDDSFIREVFANEMEDNPWLSGTDGYESMSPPLISSDSAEFDGVEGIYRFLEECDRAPGRLG